MFSREISCQVRQGAAQECVCVSSQSPFPSPDTPPTPHQLCHCEAKEFFSESCSFHSVGCWVSPHFFIFSNRSLKAELLQAGLQLLCLRVFQWKEKLNLCFIELKHVQNVQIRLSVMEKNELWDKETANYCRDSSASQPKTPLTWILHKILEAALKWIDWRKLPLVWFNNLNYLFFLLFFFWFLFF